VRLKRINMALAPELKERRLNKNVCMKCYTVNPKTSKKCRKCGGKQLRPKKQEKKVK